MKPEHKEELKRILDAYDDKIKDAESLVKLYEQQAVDLTRAKRMELLALVYNMATWKMGQLFNDNGKLWKVTDIRSCATSQYYDLDVAYTVTAVNSIGKTLSKVYQVNISDEDIIRNKWQPIDNAKDVYVLPVQILAQEIKVIRKNKHDFLYLIKGVKGKYYTFDYDMDTLTINYGLVIKRGVTGHSYTLGKYYVFAKYYTGCQPICLFEVKNLQLVKRDDKELIGVLVEGLL